MLLFRVSMRDNVVFSPSNLLYNILSLFVNTALIPFLCCSNDSLDPNVLSCSISYNLNNKFAILNLGRLLTGWHSLYTYREDEYIENRSFVLLFPMKQ